MGDLRSSCFGIARRMQRANRKSRAKAAVLCCVVFDRVRFQIVLVSSRSMTRRDLAGM